MRPWNHSSLLACSHQLCFYDFFVGSDQTPPQKSTLLHERQAVSSPLRLGDFIDTVPMLTKEGKCEDWETRKKGVFTNWTDFWHQILRSYWLKSPMEEMCPIGCKECDSPNDSWQNASICRGTSSLATVQWKIHHLRGWDGAEQGLVSFYCQGDWEETMQRLAVLTYRAVRSVQVKVKGCEPR